MCVGPIDFICTASVGYTGLHLSAAWGHLETLRALVEAGANPALKNCHEECAYDIAVRYGRMQCADYLEAAGVWSTSMGNGVYVGSASSHAL